MFVKDINLTIIGYWGTISLRPLKPDDHDAQQFCTEDAMRRGCLPQTLRTKQESSGNRRSATGIILAVLISGIPAWSTAQDRPAGTVAGRVLNATTERPIVGVGIEVIETGDATTTDSQGRFSIDVPVGVYQLRIRAIGYQPIVRANTVVGSGKPVEIEVALTPVAVQLEGIEVRPSFFQQPSEYTTSSRSIGADETRRAPGVQEDVVRSVALLPGVGVTTGGRNDLIVRGGAPYENLFLVDGIEVPNINHFGSQGSTGGPLSLINVDFVRRTDFSAGGFSAKYGDRTASLTSIDLRDGEDTRLTGELNLSATGFGAILEGPIAGNTTYLLSVRRSYLDLLFKRAGFSFIPSYVDLQFKTTTRLDTENTVSFLLIGAVDRVDFVNDDADDRYDNSRILAPEQNQYFGGITWKRLLGSGVLTTTLGRTYTQFETVQSDSLDPPQTVFSNLSTEGSNSLRVDLVQQLGVRFELNVGNATYYSSKLAYDVVLDGRYRLDSLGTPRPFDVDTSFTGLRNATYAQGHYQLTDGLQASLGARLTYYGFLDGALRLDPRLAVRARITPTVFLNASAGRYHQAPSYIWLIGDPGNPGRLTPIESDQAVLGIESNLRPDTRLQLEVYYKAYRDYPARMFRPSAVLAPAGFEDVTTDIPFGPEPLTSEGAGRAYGAELFVQKRLSSIPFYGLLSISVSKAEFTSLDGAERVGAYDARFLGNLVTGWRPGRDWELSGKFRLATGLPTTPFIEEGPATGQLDFSRYNDGPRLPDFHSLDLRVDKRWSFRTVQLVTYIDVQNVYGRANVTAYEWDYRAGQPEPNESLGVLPTIGVNIEF
jgi:hypothetical protein